MPPIDLGLQADLAVRMLIAAILGAGIGFEREIHDHPAGMRTHLLVALGSAIFTELCEDLADDLRRKGYVGRTIGLKLRYDNFKTVTRDRTIAQPTMRRTTMTATDEEKFGFSIF